MGFCSDRSIQKYPFNGKILIGLLFYAFNLISDFIFLWFEAKSVRQYLDIIYMAATIMTFAANFTIVVLKTNEMFEFIQKSEKIVNKSKLISYATKFFNGNIKTMTEYC